MGFARGPGPAAGSGRRPGTSSDVGIPGRSGGARAKLGDAHARSATRRGRAHVGCARRRRASGPRARGTHLADAECAFLEPARSRVGGSEGGRPGARGAGLERLGRSGSRRRRAAADRRAVMGFSRGAGAVHVALAGMERACGARVGRAQDRGAGSTRFAVLVGARGARRAARPAGTRTAAMERAVSSTGARRGSGLENPGPDPGRAGGASGGEHNGRRALRRRQLTARPGGARITVTPTLGGPAARGVE